MTAERTDSPKVAMLLREVGQLYGHPVKTQSDFILLAAHIEAKTRQHISDSTIKRLWVHSLAYDTVSDRTLNVLSQYAGYGHYGDFLDKLKSGGIVESEIIPDRDALKPENLSPGDTILIAWMPDRECRLKYLGNRQFEAVECHNSKLREGDTFFCSSLMKGRVLYADNLVHEGKPQGSYEMGSGHGLTRVELER